MNYIDYSNWFDIDGFHALLSNKQVDFSDIEKRKEFVESLSLDHNGLVMLEQVPSNQVVLQLHMQVFLNIQHSKISC